MDGIPNVDFASIATAMAVNIGIVNGVQLLSPKVKGFISFAIAMVLGIVFGFLHWFGLSGVEVGIVAGLASSGLFKLTQNVGGK